MDSFLSKEIILVKIKKGDKVWLNFVVPKTEFPEYEVCEVLSDGELCKLRHIKSGSLQKSVIRTERLIKQQNV